MDFSLSHDVLSELKSFPRGGVIVNVGMLNSIENVAKLKVWNRFEVTMSRQDVEGGIRPDSLTGYLFIETVTLILLLFS